MNQAAAAILLIALSAPTLADENLCKRTAGAAEIIMEVRQEGAEQHRLLGFAGTNTLLRQIITQAYQVRQHANNQRRTDEVIRYRLMWHLDCYRIAKKSTEV